MGDIYIFGESEVGYLGCMGLVPIARLRCEGERRYSDAHSKGRSVSSKRTARR